MPEPVVDRAPAQRVVVRRTEHFLDLKLAYYTALVVVSLAVVYAWPPGAAPGAGAPSSAARADAGRAAGDVVGLRELGHELLARGLAEQAVEAYDRWLREGSPDGREAASLCFQLGELCKDKLGDHARAARYYLMVRHYDPGNPRLADVGLRVVACLDALGKGRQSQQELDRLTSTGPAQAVTRAASPVVARAGSRDFTVDDVDEAMARLPQAARSAVSGPDGRLRVLREALLAPHLLAEAGRRQGLDRDPSVVRQVADFQRSLLANRVVEARLRSLPAPAAAELERFYRAEGGRFREPARRRFTAWKVPTGAQAGPALEKLRQGASVEGVLPTTFGPVAPGSGLPSVAGGERLVDLAFAASVGDFAGPVELDGGGWLVRPDEELPGALPPLEQIRERVAAAFASQRQSDELQRLLDEQIKIQGVTVDPLAFPAEASGSPTAAGGGR